MIGLPAIEAVQLRLFELAAQQEQLRLDFRKLRESRRSLAKQVIQIRSQIARLLQVDRKACTKCGFEMAVDQFYPEERNRGGLSSWCIQCKTAANRARYHERKRAA